jgi:hypothetical protein
MTDGVDLSKRLHGGHMPRDKAAAHARLASLPSVRHERAQKSVDDIARARSEKSAETRRRSGKAIRGTPVSLPNSRPPKGGA